MSGSEESPPLKILFVHENSGPTGGAETNIQITADELKARGHELALLYTSPRHDARWITVFSTRLASQAHLNIDARNERPLTRNEVQVGNSEETSNSRLRDQILTRVSEVLRVFEPDVIYAHKLLSLELFEQLLGCGIPAVRMVHDHEMYCLRQYKYNPLTRAVCHRPSGGYCVFPCLAPIARNRNGRFPIRLVNFRQRLREMDLSRRCERLVVYSDYSRMELVRNRFDPQKIDIHVPIRTWGNEGPMSSFSPKNVILFAGQIIRGKGVDLLIKALSKLTVPFEAVLLGDGSHRAYCEALATKLGLADRVKFVGYVPHDQMRDYYLEASVFAMPSVWPEPFGMAGPEAMRYGLPVVAFDVGGIPEWLNDGSNGFLAPWMDVDAFAARLQLLLTKKSLARTMGAQGMQHVNETYNSRTQVARLEKLFFQVTKGGRAARECRRSPTAAASDAAESLIPNERQFAEKAQGLGAVSVNTL
jgi:glycosyltransferase involved in cell wall biosynthesis